MVDTQAVRIQKQVRPPRRDKFASFAVEASDDRRGDGLVECLSQNGMVSTVEYKDVIAGIDSDARDMAEHKALGKDRPPMDDFIVIGLSRWITGSVISQP